MDNDLIQDTNLDLLQVNAVEVEYSGIAPINVDNQEHTISLDPSALSSKLDTSAFDEWTATHSAGEEYSAGEGIDITDHVISYTGDPGDATPWISGNKIITSADTMQPGEFIQVLSSFDLSGNKNHFITVKGQGYYFPTNQDLKERVGVDDYLPLSSFSSYTASIASNLENNWNYTNSAYSQSLNNYYNKLDISAFSSWSSEHSGDYLTKESADTLYQPIGDYLTTADSGNFYPMEGNPSGFLTGVDLTNYYEKNETSSKEEIENAITSVENIINNLSGEYYPLTSNPSGYLTGVDLTEYYQKNETSSKEEISSALTSKLDESAFTSYTADADTTEYSAGDNIDITNHVISSKDWSTEIESATSGKADMNTVFANCVRYLDKPENGEIVAQQNTLANVGQIVGSSNSNFFIVPSGVLQVPNIITANTNGLTVSGLSAHPNYGITADGLTAYADSAYGGFSANGISAGKRGPLSIEGERESISATGGSGFTFSSFNTGFGTAQLTTANSNSIVQVYSPKFEARNTAGAGFSIEASGAKGYDHNGNVVWDTSNPPAPNNLVGYADTKASTGGLNSNIILTTVPKSYTGPLSSAPYTILDSNGLRASYGPSSDVPNAILEPGGFTAQTLTGNNSARATVNLSDIKYEYAGTAWSLKDSVQKREIECDTATSAITAIAGSAIGGVDLSNYYEKNETSSKEEISDAFEALSGIDDPYELSAGDGISIVNNTATKKTIITCTATAEPVDTGAFYPMTGNPSGFLTAHQSLTNYYTKNETSSKEQISAAITGKQDNLTFAYNSSDAISSINGSAIAGNNTNNLSAGEGISIVETADKVVISCTATGVEFDPTYMSAQIDNKLNKSESANYYPKTGNPSGFLTAHQSLSNYYRKNETSSKTEIANALQNAGHEYTGIAPIGVNNSTYQISAETWTLSAGEGLVLSEDSNAKVATLSITGGGITGDTIDLSAGEGISIVETGDKVLISNNISAGSNMSFVYDSETNKIRIDANDAFPITATDGNTTWSADCKASAFTMGRNTSRTDIGAFGFEYRQAPSVNVSGSWYDLALLMEKFKYAIPVEAVANSGLATGQNILYVVTGS